MSRPAAVQTWWASSSVLLGVVVEFLRSVRLVMQKCKNVRAFYGVLWFDFQVAKQSCLWPCGALQPGGILPCAPARTRTNFTQHMQHLRSTDDNIHRRRPRRLGFISVSFRPRGRAHRTSSWMPNRSAGRSPDVARVRRRCLAARRFRPTPQSSARCSAPLLEA